MFTGIVTNLGKVISKSENRLTIKTDKTLTKKLSKGVSMAVDGICLTVVNLAKDEFSVDYMSETKAKTNLKYLKVGDLVNLEPPATYGDFLSGHLVQGHIDGVGKLESIQKDDNSHILKFSISKELSKYIVNKGPIAVNGISLTVIEAGKDFFTIGIVPHTWNNTTLHTLQLGDYVNIELDLLAKYVEKLVKEGA